MKKTCILLVAVMLLLTACSNSHTNVEAPKNDFKFLSISWGEDWETVQKSDVFNEVETEILRDNADMTGVIAKNISFYGKSVEALLSFENKENNGKGLFDVTVRFQENDEADILAQMTEIYGELQTSYPDKNGIPNPISPAGWYTEDRIETVLTEDEQAEIIKPYKEKGWDDTRIDAVLRTPVVTIFFDEENNTVRFSSKEAFVKTVKK